MNCHIEFCPDYVIHVFFSDAWRHHTFEPWGPPVGGAPSRAIGLAIKTGAYHSLLAPIASSYEMMALPRDVTRP